MTHPLNTCDYPVLPDSLMSWRIDQDVPLNLDDVELCTKDVLVLLPLHIPEGKDEQAELQLIRVKNATVRHVAHAIHAFYHARMTKDDLDILSKYSSSEQQYDELRRQLRRDGSSIIKRYQILPQRYRTFGGLIPLVEKAKDGSRIYLLTQ